MNPYIEKRGDNFRRVHQEFYQLVTKNNIVKNKKVVSSAILKWVMVVLIECSLFLVIIDNFKGLNSFSHK